jgi:hypothetical protein
MKNEMVLVGVLFLLVFASGCALTETKYVCPDGTIVTSLDQCGGEETPLEEETGEELPTVPVETEPEEEQEEVPTEETEEEVDDKVLTKITVQEGEVVTLKPQVQDPDDDTITYTFSEPVGADGKWQTQRGDAGTYEVTVTASDGQLKDSQKVLVVVEGINNPPVLEEIPDVTVNEGETVSLRPIATDPDGDSVKLTYSGWMTSSTYTTDYDDAGTHIVTVKASDGYESVTKDVKVTVVNVNRPPKIVNIVKG